MKRKLSFLFLMLCLVLSLTTTAFAADQLPNDTDNDNVITLVEDVELTAGYKIMQDLTIDLAGHSIKPAAGFDAYNATAKTGDDFLLAVTRGYTLTIKDSVGGGSIDTGNNSGIYSAVKLTIKDENDATHAAKLTVEGGTLKGYYYAIGGNGSRHNTEITIEDGTFGAYCTDDSNAIYHPQEGKLTIKGGTFEGYNSAVELRGGTMKITGGTFTATANEYKTEANGSGTTTVGAAIAIAQHATKKNISVTISGGAFTGLKALSESNPQGNLDPKVNISVTNGTFNGEIAITDTEGASISGGSFTDLNVLKYLGDNANVTIKLAKDVTLSELLKVDSGKSVTIDLNGKTLSRSNGNTTIYVNGGNLTVKGTGEIKSPVVKDPAAESYAIYVGENGQFTLDNGKVSSDKYSVFLAKQAQFTMNGGTVTGGYFAISGNGNGNFNDTKITINDGTVTSTGTEDAAIYHPQTGELNINGGTISGATAIEVKAGAVKVGISGNPEITATQGVLHKASSNGNSTIGYAVAVVENAAYSGNANVMISNGSFNGLVAIEDDDSDPANNSGNLTISGGTFSQDPSAYKVEGTIVMKDGEKFTVKANGGLTSGTYLTEPSVAGGYYYIKNSDNTYTVYRASSGGSGSGSSNTTTTTSKNNDGSTTTTTTNKKTGTVTETTKTSNGTTATTVTNKRGEVTDISASVSSTAAREANKSGESVTLPVEGIEPVFDSEDAPEINVSIPSGSSSVTVEIPVENVTPGTVVVIVHEDGTETIVPTSRVTENGIEVTLTENATIKVIDNSKSFSDVPADNVFSDEIASMSARGIMVGKNDGTFDVHGSVTLNQIANVAGRVSGKVATDDYQGGIEWAAENGLATGDVPATRGDVLSALYLAAGTPESVDSGKLAQFKDTDQIPAEMLPAVIWAIENGIIKGNADGTLGLGANVTRGQAAAFAGRALNCMA